MGVLAVTPRPSTCIQTGAKNQAVTEAGGWESARFKNELKISERKQPIGSSTN